MSRVPAWLLALLLPTAAFAETNAELVEQVRQVEIAFAKTMADRDHSAFLAFLDDEAVFSNGGDSLTGKAAVGARWKRFYEGPEAPFSWAPDHVVVLESGTLASSSGPVFAPGGQRIGTFNSVWRRTAAGAWKIVLDKGCPPCDCSASADSR